MKARLIHIVNITLLLLIVLYSTPISFLHNCSRFNEQHTSAAIEKEHNECFLCDIRLTSFLPASFINTILVASFTCILCSLYLSRKLSAFTGRLSNKGPPVLILI